MDNIKVILVTGSRNWTKREIVWAALQAHLGNSIIGIIRHGGCPSGVDKFADDWGNIQGGIAVDRVPANWDQYGKSAGPRRNTRMVGLKADICLAFPLGKSSGTRDCMRKAEAAGIKVINYGDE